MAGNPADYSKIFVTEFEPLYTEAAALALDFQRAGYPQFAQEVARAIDRLDSRLRQIALRIAQRARESIVEAEQTSRVRDDTEGEGGPRLQDFIGKSDPLDAVPGSVGVNDEEYLEQSPVDWWWTNEEGYAGHKGREIKGFFYEPGFTNMSAPHPDKFRHHPLFAPTGGRGRTMHIRRAIPARNFVRKGQAAVAGEWHREVASARRQYDDDIDRILARFRAAVLADRRRRRPRGGGR